jgi:hypothetical protein
MAADCKSALVRVRRFKSYPLHHFKTFYWMPCRLHGSQGRGRPPEIFNRFQRMLKKLSRPLERFLHTEAAGGMVMLLAAGVALLLANSPFSAHYQAAISAPLRLDIGSLAFASPFKNVIKDALLPIFFL